MTSWKAALQRMTWGPGRHQADHESAMNMRSKKANRILGYIRKIMARLSRDMIIPLYPALARPCLECCVSFWAHQYKKGKDILERVK